MTQMLPPEFQAMLSRTRVDRVVPEKRIVFAVLAPDLHAAIESCGIHSSGSAGKQTCAVVTGTVLDYTVYGRPTIEMLCRVEYRGAEVLEWLAQNRARLTR
jgi:hypothetical protein